MERVIMLKWFKKLTGRLFGDEVEEIEETTETKEIETQYETETERQRPNFRFPIITDAEIYGWDDDEYEGEHKEQTTQQNKGNQAADYFEPTPLFENERWPVHEEAIVHRTRRAPKDERPISVERLEKSEALKVELESIQKKKGRIVLHRQKSLLLFMAIKCLRKRNPQYKKFRCLKWMKDRKSHKQLKKKAFKMKRLLRRLQMKKRCHQC